jgi:hypothetical protein
MAFGNGPRLVTTGLDLLVDAADQQSYPGSGTVWRDLRSGVTGSLTGSVSYTSEFYGGLTFSDSSSAVIFPSTTANYGTGSFTVEMAFKPTFINGRHYLMSKNSGSFPNWAIYLSGSAGTGKLWSEFRINASVSCSYSSSTVFQTGSAYQVDVRILPGLSASGIYVNGQSEGGVFGNGGGSLSSTASLFVGNFSQNNNQNFSGSIFTLKTYSTTGFTLPAINFNATATRLAKQPIPQEGLNRFELLVVAGGGSGGTVRQGGGNSGGGGAGGLQYISSFIPSTGSTQVIVGAGGTRSGDTFPGNQGQNSVFASYVSIGGGFGGKYDGGTFGTGGTGGSGGGSSNTTVALGTPGQGNNGSFNTSRGGGGGGANTAGVSGEGGSGSYIAPFAIIGGSPAGWFAGGGGGSEGQGGIGGGGSGSFGIPGGISSVSRSDGAVNTGGGGGGVSGLTTTPYIGSQGGSGIVAIRYNGTPIAIGGEITQSEGFTYHVFRTVGPSSFTIF